MRRRLRRRGIQCEVLRPRVSVLLWWLACFSALVSRKHCISDSRISQRGIKIKPTVNQKTLETHCEGLRKSFEPTATGGRGRDQGFREVFRPLTTVQELRSEINQAAKGKTGRLTTMDELSAMSDDQLTGLLKLTNLILAGECPCILKIGDVLPLLKDLERARPVTCLDPLFKVADAVIARGTLAVCQTYNLLPDCTFGFVKGGGCEWPADIVGAVHWHARRNDIAALAFFLDATSAYDTISHSGLTASCASYGMPADCVSKLVAHVSGHSRVVNTAYGLGDEAARAPLAGGVAQGAPSSPPLYTVTASPAHAYAASIMQGYQMNIPRGLEDFIYPAPGGGQGSLKCRRLKVFRNADGELRARLLVYADDDAGVIGAKIHTKAEAGVLIRELEDGASALTVGLAVMGIQTNHRKSYLTASPEMWRLAGDNIAMRIPALTATGRFALEAISTIPPGTADGVTMAERGTVRYLGPCIAWNGTGHDDGVAQYWRERDLTCEAIVRKYKMDVHQIAPAYRVACRSAEAILYQRLRLHWLVAAMKPALVASIRATVAGTGLHALGLLNTVRETHDCVGSVMLAPVSMGGGGMLDPVVCAVKDQATFMLAALQHDNALVRVAMLQMLDASRGPWRCPFSRSGDQTPVDRVQFIRDHAEISLHKGTNKPRPPRGETEIRWPCRRAWNHVPPIVRDILPEDQAKNRQAFPPPPADTALRGVPWKWEALPVEAGEARTRSQSLALHPDIAWMGLDSRAS